MRPFKNGAASPPDIAQLAHRLALGRSAPKAGRALGQLGAPAVPVLREALRHDNPFVRSGALYGLEAAAEAAGVDVVDAVVEALTRDTDARVQETACGVLARLGAGTDPRATAALDGALASVDERVRAAALSARPAR